MTETEVPLHPGTLGDRMKGYEWDLELWPRSHIIIRVDGRAFHTFLKDANRPFDFAFMNGMNYAARALCQEVAGARLGYVQSDEISVYATTVDRERGEHWFNGSIPKITSVAASVVTEAFNAGYVHWGNRGGQFDARVIELPTWWEVANYFLWRQQDWMRNAVSMVARAQATNERLPEAVRRHFEHKALIGKSVEQMRQMLSYIKGAEHLLRDVETGRICIRRSEERAVRYTDRRSGEECETSAVRSWWSVEPAPLIESTADNWLSEKPADWLAELIPGARQEAS